MSWKEYRPNLKALLVLAGLLALEPFPGPVRAEPLRPEPAGPTQEVNRSYQKAEALYKQGKIRESAQEYERAVSLAERAFGEDHPTTINMILNLGYAYVALSDGKRA